MSQYVTAAIDAYQKQLASINSAISNESLTNDVANLKIAEINNILAILESVLNSEGNNKLLNDILVQVEHNNNLTNENKSYIIKIIEASKDLDKPNFFYNELLVKMVREKIPNGNQFTLEQIINELIIIYTDLQKYYEQYKDVFRFNTNVHNAFNSKVTGLKEILKHYNRGSLTRELCQTIIDRRLEPIVFDLITPKLRREQYEGFKAIDKTGLYIEIYSFPPEYSELQTEYHQKIKELYSDDSPIKFEQHHQPLINQITQQSSNPPPQIVEQESEATHEKSSADEQQYQQIIEKINTFITEINVSKNAYELTFKNYADRLLEIYNNVHSGAKSDSNNQLNPECFQNIAEINTNIKKLVIKSESAHSSSDKVFEIIKSLESQEDHYLQQLQEALKIELAKIHELIANIQSTIANDSNELNGKNYNVYSDEIAKSVNELGDNIKPLMEATNNINDIFTILKDLSENINKSVIDALSENVNTGIISKTIIDANKINNELAVNALTEIGNSILKANTVESDAAKAHLDNLTTVIKLADKNIQNLVNEITKIELNLSAVIERFKTDLKKRDDDFKNFMNNEFTPCINKTLESNDDLNKSLKINMGFVDKSNKNSNYRNGYIWSVVNFAFTLILLCLILVLMYNIKSSSSDSAELNRIMNNLNNVDKQNQVAIKKILEIK